MEVLLCGDIGGTHTRLALFRREEWDPPLLMRDYSSREFPSLLAIVHGFLEEARQSVPSARPIRAAFAVPGIASQPRIWLVNVPWTIDVQEVSQDLGLESVQFLNDFAAVCLAVTRLTPHHLQKIGLGEPQPDQPRAVLGAGTGLGEGVAVWNRGHWVVVPSEGGNADLAPHNDLEMRLVSWLLERHGHASWEFAVSGPGLLNLYLFMQEGEGLRQSPLVSRELEREDAARVIVRHGLADDPLCTRVLDLFCDLYGAEAGNLALRYMALGGVFLAGGLSVPLASRLLGGRFREAFERKGRFRHLVVSIPTYLVTHPQPGLVGAAIAAAEAPGR